MQCASGLPDLSGKHVLHLRCGTGEASADLLALGALVSGIDPSEEALAVARERVPGAAFFQADLHEIPLQLRRRRFALVYADEGTVARVPDLGLFASAAAAALRKSGRLILFDRHPVADCVEPVEPPLARELLRRRAAAGSAQIVTAVVGAGLDAGRARRAATPEKEARRPARPADPGRVRSAPSRRSSPELARVSRMNPWRAALTSATASGNRTRIASRRASACSSGATLRLDATSAAAVSSTAVFSVSVANCSRCASATDSACCSANSRSPRIRSSGSPPNGKLKPPSMSEGYAELALVAGLDLELELA